MQLMITLHTGSGRDQFTNDDVFFQADQRIHFTVDCCFCQDLGGLLEGSGAEEGISSQRSRKYLKEQG